VIKVSRVRVERLGKKKKLWVTTAVIGATCLALLTVTDSSTADASTSSPNMVKDPRLATGTSAWTVTGGGALSVVAGHDGDRALRVLNTTNRALTIALNDKVNTVASTKAGAVYQASAWLQTDSPGVSSAVRLMEYAGSANRGSALASKWMRSTAWTQVTVNYTAKTSGASLDLNMLTWTLPAHKSFVVSGPSLVVLAVPAPPTSTTPAPAPTTPAPAPTTPAPTTPAPAPATPAPAPPTAVPAPTGYQLVWSDEFNSIDRAKWNVRNNSWAGNEESIDTSRPDNVFVSNGALTLRALKQTYTAGSTTRQYTSGYLDTIGKEAWQYGRIEMRAKLPTAQGMWPAFWLRDNNGGLGELDVMEAIGGMPTKSVQTIHQSTNGDMARAGHEDILPSGVLSTWHTYSVDREPGSVKWYIDDRLVFSQSSTTLSWLESAFNQPMNIRLNLQVGGSMPAYYRLPVQDAPVGASDYVIDYVRVYQR